MNPPASLPTYERHADHDLIAAMQQGDERALGALYDRWSARVHSLALAMLKNPAEAEEITEETFWQAWRQAARYDAQRGEAGSWLMIIARSRILDRLRFKRRRPEEQLDEIVLRAVPSDEATPEEHASLSERGQAVRRAMSSLPGDQREALTLAYFGGLSQSEIAEKCGLPLGTVKTRMRLGMNRLRDSLSSLREEVRA